MSSDRSIVLTRYTQSLFALAKDHGVVEKVEEMFSAFEELLSVSTDFKKVISSPVIKNKQRFSVIEDIFSYLKIENTGEARTLFLNFLKLLIENGRLALLPAVIKKYHEMVIEARGESFAEVVSAKTLTKAQEKEIKEILEDVSKKKIHLKMHVDPSLIAGFILRFGSYEIDASLINKLSSLKFALKEVG